MNSKSIAEIKKIIKPTLHWQLIRLRICIKKLIRALFYIK
jgi:hypothetical protein